MKMMKMMKIVILYNLITLYAFWYNFVDAQPTAPKILNLTVEAQDPEVNFFCKIWVNNFYKI